MKKVFIVISLIIIPTLFLQVPTVKADQILTRSGVESLPYAVDSLTAAGYSCTKNVTYTDLHGWFGQPVVFSL